MLTSRKTPQGGFTLIELVVVIVILGILAAFAIPRFANIAKDARVSALNGLAGSLRSTSALVHGMALAQNQNGATGTVIILALNNLDPATYTVVAGTGSVTIEVVGAGTPANCSVVYAEPTGVGLGASVTPSTTLQADC
jgi:MSHA pilin protein MshA